MQEEEFDWYRIYIYIYIPGWDGIRWDGMGWDGMGWDGMGWDGMGWDGMGWDGMGWDVVEPIVKIQT